VPSVVAGGTGVSSAVTVALPRGAPSSSYTTPLSTAEGAAVRVWSAFVVPSSITVTPCAAST